MYYVLPSRFLPLFCIWTRLYEDTTVAIPPIPSGSSGHREQPGTNWSRIWTQKSAVIQAYRRHRFIHELDRWCLRWVITWILTPSRRVSATHFALQPGWLKLCTERDCETVDILLSSPWPVDHYHIWSKERVELRDCGHFTISSPWPVDHYHIWSKERVELRDCGQLPFPFPWSVDYYRIWSGVRQVSRDSWTLFRWVCLE